MYIRVVCVIFVAVISVLVRAAWHGDVSLLLTELAVVAANDDDVNEALLIAACLGHIQCVTALLKRGADPDCSDVDGDTPLMLAIANNFVGMSALTAYMM